jgi:CRISPR-associated protein Csb3
MSNIKPTINVNVDPTNPGQFFACCGLLELAHRLESNVEGWFSQSARQFHIASPSTLSDVLDSLIGCVLTNTMTMEEHARFAEISSWSVAKRKDAGVEEEGKELERRLRESPIEFKEPFDIRVDWFIDGAAGGIRFKTWAGRQSVLDISTSMKDALSAEMPRTEDCLQFSVMDCGLPFNFDSDLGNQGGAIDVGFSFDPLASSALTRIEPSARPVLELLAFIGLQRFRPAEVKRQNRFLYTAWNRPLPIQVAMPAACGALPITDANQYEFRLLYRTKYLKSFLPAIPFTGASHE